MCKVENCSYDELIMEDFRDVLLTDETPVKRSGKKTYDKQKDTSSMFRNMNVNTKCLLKFVKNNGGKAKKVTANKYMITSGRFAGSTVEIKARYNYYNKGGNFSITDDDMNNSDYISIYSYDKSTNSGSWHLASMNAVKTMKIGEHKRWKHKNGYWVFSEVPVIEQSLSAINIIF